MPQQPSADGITIGRLARRTGCNIETVRYYEKIGLIDAPPRSTGGYRLYDRNHLQQVGFIRRCRELGFPLPRIQALLALASDAGNHTRAEVKDIVASQREEIERKIADLGRLSAALSELAAHCDGANATAGDCPILDALAGDCLAADAGRIDDDA